MLELLIKTICVRIQMRAYTLVECTHFLLNINPKFSNKTLDCSTKLSDNSNFDDTFDKKVNERLRVNKSRNGFCP